jgi:lipid-A-disaccharide synthase
VLPGSRKEEVDRHLPVLIAAAQRLAHERSARFIVVAATDSLAIDIAAAWPAQCGGREAVVRADAAGAVAEADVAWVASGTAVLETALRGVPQIAMYRIGDAQYRFVQRYVPRLLAGPVTLPNLVTGERFIPELLQDDLSPDRLVRETNALLDDAPNRRQMDEGYARMREALGPPDALARIGAYVDGLIAAAGKPS